MRRLQLVAKVSARETNAIGGMALAYSFTQAGAVQVRGNEETSE
jgi:hypothetical protein